MNGHQYQLPDGAVVIAAITSCQLRKSRNLACRQLKVKAFARPEAWKVASNICKAELMTVSRPESNNLVGYGCTNGIGNLGRCLIH